MGFCLFLSCFRFFLSFSFSFLFFFSFCACVRALLFCFCPTIPSLFPHIIDQQSTTFTFQKFFSSPTITTTTRTTTRQQQQQQQQFMPNFSFSHFFFVFRFSVSICLFFSYLFFLKNFFFRTSQNFCHHKKGFLNRYILYQIYSITSRVQPTRFFSLFPFCPHTTKTPTHTTHHTLTLTLTLTHAQHT